MRTIILECDTLPAKEISGAKLASRTKNIAKTDAVNFA